jgi:hypothetical protein
MSKQPLFQCSLSTMLAWMVLAAVFLGFNLTPSSSLHAIPIEELKFSEGLRYVYVVERT